MVLDIALFEDGFEKMYGLYQNWWLMVIFHNIYIFLIEYKKIV